MDLAVVLAAFDAQVRRNPTSEPTISVERDGPVIRVVSTGDGWNGLVWSRLEEADADQVIAAEVARSAHLGPEWEWKYYSYDTPRDLPDRLVAAGLVPDPDESLMVAVIADLDVDVPPPPGVDLVPVLDEAGVAALVSASAEAFGEAVDKLGQGLLASLSIRPPIVAAYVAVADGQPVAAGRVELPPSGEFASLWGGGTIPAWRGRGVFRALVAQRARVARDRGYRYLQVDAAPTSRPILERLGFVQLATTTPYRLPAGSGQDVDMIG
jgi:GNAT superfamily N-acetyltransferase